MSQPRVALSLGAGTQSSAMLLMAQRGEFGPPPEAAIFADTQAEPQYVYEYLDYLKSVSAIPIIVVTAGSLEAVSLRTRGNYVSNKVPVFAPWNSRLVMLMRQCTNDFKVVPIRRWLSQWAGPADVELWLGISTDEAHRAKDSNVRWIRNRYPLIEKGLNRSQCLSWLNRHGYRIPRKSACVFCPYRSDHEWLRLKRESPADFQRAAQFERALNRAYAEARPSESITVFLHRSCRPLDEIEFRDEHQIDLFGNECEGMCGV